MREDFHAWLRKSKAYVKNSGHEHFPYIMFVPNINPQFPVAEFFLSPGFKKEGDLILWWSKNTQTLDKLVSGFQQRYRDNTVDPSFRVKPYITATKFLIKQEKHLYGTNYIWANDVKNHPEWAE